MTEKHPRRERWPMIALLLLSAALATACADIKPDPIPAGLIGRLGSERFDERVSAYKALERLGGDALPALHAAADDDSADPRIRSRVRALIESAVRRAESDRVARPTMVRLDFRGERLDEVVDTLNSRHDLGLVLQLAPTSRHRGFGGGFDDGSAKRLAEVRARGLTLVSDGPLPFWEAIDRLCAAGVLRYGVSPDASYGASQRSLLLLSDRSGRGQVSDSGPFRVQISGVRLVYERDFTRVPELVEKPTTGDGVLTVALAVLAEPGLWVYPSDRIVIDEAVDDRGRALRVPVPATTDQRLAAIQRQGMNGRGPVRVVAELVAPDPPPAAIRMLRGKVPVFVVSKRPEPLVMTLRVDGIAGKPFRTRDVTLVIESVAANSVIVTFRSHRADPPPDQSPPDFAAFRIDRVLDHLELRDAGGKRIDYSVNGQMRGADGEGFYDRYTLVVPAAAEKPGAGFKGGSKPTPAPAELRFFDFVQKAEEVPFDLRDVPMP